MTPTAQFTLRRPEIPLSFRNKSLRNLTFRRLSYFRMDTASYLRRQTAEMKFMYFPAPASMARRSPTA